VVRHPQLGIDRSGTGHIDGIESAHLSYPGSQGIMGARRHQNVFTAKQFSQVRISGRHYLTPYLGVRWGFETTSSSY
jgi:hypothetical protein